MILCLYIEAEVTQCPLLKAVHLTGIGWDEDGLKSDVINSCSRKKRLLVPENCHRGSWKQLQLDGSVDGTWLHASLKVG